MQIKAGQVLGLDKVTFHRLVHGIRKPSARLCFTIAKLTDGAVPAGSWFEDDPQADKDDAKPKRTKAA